MKICTEQMKGHEDENTNMSESGFITKKIYVNFNVFLSMMLT